MRIACLIVLLCVCLPAAAQMVKCVDERGRTHYTDKPEVDCKTAKGSTVIAPAPAPAPKGAPKPVKPAAAEKKTAAAKREPTAGERARFESDCKINQELLEWLQSPRAADVKNRAARAEKIQQAMRGCS